MLGDRAASMPPKLLCCGVAGALGVQSHAPSADVLDVESQHMWWQQEDPDEAVAERLPVLMRGWPLLLMVGNS